MDRIDPVGVAEWIRDERVTAWNGPPALIHSLASMDDESRPTTSRRSTRCGTAAADCPEPVRAAFEEKFGMPVLDDLRVERGADGRHHRRSRRRRTSVGASGRPLPHLAMQIVDDELCVAPGDQRASTAGVYHPMLGYWDRHEATAETLRRR